jgi:hypothetical protein
MLAAESGHLDVVKYLVQEEGADKEKENKVRVKWCALCLLLLRVFRKIVSSEDP